MDYGLRKLSAVSYLLSVNKREKRGRKTEEGKQQAEVNPDPKKETVKNALSPS